MPTKRDRAIELAEQARKEIESTDGLFDRLSLGVIDDIADKLRALRSLMGTCPDANLAIRYLEKMKRPRADKQAEGECAKDAIVGALMSAYNIAA